mmetsp:Transcript_81491/g.189266  ORF Transcript_81491/g.189266 Transcript_81491/m.189266 type:complete len:80 (-) Transcript_81491:263-502(-)
MLYCVSNTGSITVLADTLVSSNTVERSVPGQGPGQGNSGSMVMLNDTRCQCGDGTLECWHTGKRPMALIVFICQSSLNR